MTANEELQALLREQGVNPAEDLESNAVALAGLFLSMKYGAKNVPEDALTMAGAIRKIVKGGNAIRIRGHEGDDGRWVYEISSLEHVDESKVGQTVEVDGEEVPIGAPRVVGVGIRSAGADDSPLVETINDIEFVNAFNAIQRHLDGKEAIGLEVGDVSEEE